MAKQTIIELSDDISGERLGDGAGRTVAFSFDGASYEIDLTHEHIEELREALQPYVSASRRVSGASRGTARSGSTRSSGAKPRRDASEVQAIREWAAANGYQLAARGRIPTQVTEAFRNR